MSTSRNAIGFFCTFFVAITFLLAGCSGHGGNIVPSLQQSQSSAVRRPLSGPGGSFEQLILQSNPTQYFELEETGCCTASNIGSSGASGTYTSSNVTYSLSGPLQGETSTAIGLPGNTGSTAISMGVSLPNPSTSGAFTVEDWVFPVFTSTSTSVNAYYTIWGYDGAHRLLIGNPSGQLLTQFGAFNFRSVKKLTPNAWNQVVFVYDGTNESFYINGVLDSSHALSGVSLVSPYKLGQYGGTQYYKFDGRIAQHMVFPTALSASVIQSHFTAATTGTGPTPTPTPTTPPTTPPSSPPGNPTLVQQTSDSKYAPTNVTVQFGKIPAAGDVLLVLLHNNGSTTNAPITYTAPTGWTQFDLDTSQTANTYEAFYHVAGNAEGNTYVFTPSCTCRQHVWSGLEFSGINTSSPIDGHGFMYQGNRTSSTFTTPSETPSQAGDLAIVSMMPTELTTSTWTNGAGWSVDVPGSSPWSTEVIQESLASTAPVSETSTLSSANFGYAAIVLLAPGNSGSGTGPGKVDWPTWGMKPSRNSYNPVEATLTKSNVGGLHQIWSTTAGGVFSDEPVIATNVSGTSEGTADVLYVGDAHANFYAMDANTGKVLWTKTLQTQVIDPNNPATGDCRDQPGGIYGIGGSPTIDRAKNLVFVVDAMGNLYGFDLATGAQKVTSGTPMWKYQNGVNITNDYGALNEDASAGVIYVPSGAHCGLPNYGGIQQYNISSGAQSHFYTEGGSQTQGGVWGPGGPVIDPRGGANDIFFATAFGPLGSGVYPYSVVRLHESLSFVAANNPVTQQCCPDLDFGDTPLVFTPSSSGCGLTLVAASSKNGALYLYNADSIGAGPIQTIQIGTLNTNGVNVGTAAYDPTRNLVYINNGSDSTDGTLSPAIFHGLVAFTVTSGCQLQVAWQQTVGPTNLNDGPPAPPTVANGIVYYADGPGTSCTPVANPGCSGTADFYAFDASTGAVLLHLTLPGPLFTAPVVVNGHVYLTTWNGGGPGMVIALGL